MPSPYSLELTHPTEKKMITVDFLAIRKAQLFYRALNNATRQRILALLNSKTKMTVTELIDELRIDQPIVSQHLGILRKAQIVTSTRSGKHISYAINFEQMEKVIKITTDLLKK